MLSSLQLEPVISLGTTLIVLSFMAVMVREATKMAFHHSIPWEDKKRLYKSYGKWAVDLAEAFCPESDVACVEREAKRLYGVRTTRR
jgi:hypothetical protein